MSEQHLHELHFADDKHFNLYLFCRHLKLNLVNPEYFGIEHQEYQDRYKVSIGNYLFYISTKSINSVWMALAKQEAGIYDVLQKSLNDGDRFEYKNGTEFGFRPAIDIKQFTDLVNEDDEFYSLIQENFTDVESRVKGLMTATSQVIRDIATIINQEMNDVALNSDIVKDFDGILTFDSPLGRDFKVHLGFDKINPVDPNNDKLEILRTPITPEDLKTYFPTAGDKIQSRLNHVNGLVASVFESKRIAGSKSLADYAAALINGVILKPFLDQNVNYISFGGRDDWSSMGKDTPNNIACFKYLDAEVQKIYDLLESIPLEEGVEVWSIDLDTFAIFGRKDNKVVTPALQGYTQQILQPYSQGFERVLTQRLSLLDTPHIFKA